MLWCRDDKCFKSSETQNITGDVIDEGPLPKTCSQSMVLIFLFLLTSNIYYRDNYILRRRKSR